MENHNPYQVRCPGIRYDRDETCGQLMTPQFAGRYLNIQKVPFVCHQPRCSNYGKPFNFKGEQKFWSDFEKVTQLEGEIK